MCVVGDSATYISNVNALPSIHTHLRSRKQNSQGFQVKDQSQSQNRKRGNREKQNTMLAYNTENPNPC